ncbi:MAG: hypothetical protein AAF694_08145 [Bacteroidota bacterium]
MDYYLIKGHFQVVGFSPDGDSLMFKASNPKDWDKLQSHHQELFEEKLKAGEGSVQLRLQGIDALETHYGPMPIPPPKGARGKTYSKAQKPKRSTFQQPYKFGDQATHKLLSYLGVKSVKWRSSFGTKWIGAIQVETGRGLQTFQKKKTDNLEGYIVVNDIDRKGRPIAWVFGGRISSRSGTKIPTSNLVDLIKQSVNYRLVATGLVYPYFFMTLEAKLRLPLIHGVRNAQRQKMNLWAEDQTQKGITLRRFSQLTESHLIFPYLFRRMVRHQFKKQMEGYWEAVIRKKPFEANPEELHMDTFFDDTNPYVLLIDERDFVRLDSILQVSKTKLKLMTHPGNIIFLS